MLDGTLKPGHVGELGVHVVGAERILRHGVAPVTGQQDPICGEVRAAFFEQSSQISR